MFWRRCAGGVRLLLVHFLLQPPPSQERQQAGGPVLAEQEDSALGNTPKDPASEWWSPFFRVRKLISAAHSFTSGLFHWYGSGGVVAARYVTTLVATSWWWEKLYNQITPKAI